MHTHYDNLKVARTAPPEIIRAAYKTLCQKYHPDKYDDKTEALRIMKIINESYEVLSDPIKRKQHDTWISTMESMQQAKETSVPHKRLNEELSAPPKKSSIINNALHALWIIFGIILSISFITHKAEVDRHAGTAPANPYPYGGTSTAGNRAPTENIGLQTKKAVDPSIGDSRSPAGTTLYKRPTRAPNGVKWPSIAAYIGGYGILDSNGLSSVKIDNSQNDSDVFVKLYRIDGKPRPIRHVFIPKSKSFTINNITKGSFDVRYQDLNTGSKLRTEAFALQEKETRDGTQFSNVSITLYKVMDGNMNTYAIEDSEF